MSDKIHVRQRSRARYGLVHVHVMHRPDISLQARGLYSVLTTYANAERESWPKVQTLLKVLGVSRSRFYQLRDELISAGVLEVTEQHHRDGRRAASLYVLHDEPPVDNRTGPPSNPLDTVQPAGHSPSSPLDPPGPSSGLDIKNRVKEQDVIVCRHGRPPERCGCTQDRPTTCEHGKTKHCPYCPGGRLAHLEPRSVS